MTGSRNKHAWIWVAIAALSLASVSRAEAGPDSARIFSNPVLHFLVKSHSASVAARGGMVRSAQRGSARSLRSIFRDAGAGAWVAFLPVGIVALSVFAADSVGVGQPFHAAPQLAAAFQRPPPVLA